MLKAVNLHHAYRSPEGKLEVLRGVHLEIKRGEAVFILGRSGAGKSTLLHLLGGLDRVTQGHVSFENKEMSLLNEKELTEFRNRKIGFVFQFYHLLPELTVEENVELPCLIGRVRQKERMHDLIRKVGLWERRKHLPGELSGGEQQRVAIARALVNQPDIVFCDEPTGNLDDETAQTVQKLIFELNREGQTFCIVTHEENFARRGTRILKLHEGVLTA